MAEHNLYTNNGIYYSKDYYERLTLKSWFTSLEQSPLNDANSYLRLTNEL